MDLAKDKSAPPPEPKKVEKAVYRAWPMLWRQLRRPRAFFGALGRRISEALAALPTVQREAFLLQHEGGMSLGEIAALTGAGEETVKSRLRYATAKLRAALEALR